MKNILILCLCFCLLSCINENPRVELFNNSDQTIDSVSIFVSTHCLPLIIKDIKSQEKKKGILYFCNDLTSDGSYGIEIYDKGKVVSQTGFGYYTNGKSLNRSFKITIGKLGDVIVEEK